MSSRIFTPDDFFISAGTMKMKYVKNRMVRQKTAFPAGRSENSLRHLFRCEAREQNLGFALGKDCCYKKIIKITPKITGGFPWQSRH